MRKQIKQAIVSTAKAFGIKPVGRKWIKAFSSLNGSFERTPSELSFYVFSLVIVAAFITLIASFGVREYRHSGADLGVRFASAYCLVMSLLLVYLVSRAGLRYVFSVGTIRAHSTWGRLLWSEDLTGLQDVSFFTARGSTSMTLFWVERKRRMVYFDSIRTAVDASLESAEKSKAPTLQEITEDVGPSWICPHCHESNPGNFEECWKCLRMRTENSA